MVQPHKQSISVSESQHDLIQSPEEIFTLPEKNGLYGAAIWSTKDERLRDLGDVEMQKGSRLARSERQSHIRVDVTISTMQQEAGSSH